MIEGVNLTSTLPLTAIVRARADAGRVALPVSQPLTFVRFKHIVGIPAIGDNPGYSVMKLRILDALIDRLATVKNQPAVDTTPPTPAEVEAQLARLTDQLHAEVTRLTATPYGAATGAGNAADGLVLSLSA